MALEVRSELRPVPRGVTIFERLAEAPPPEFGFKVGTAVYTSCGGREWGRAKRGRGGEGLAKESGR